MHGNIEQIPANAFQLKAIQKLLEKDSTVSRQTIVALKNQRELIDNSYQNAIFNTKAFDEIETALKEVKNEYEGQSTTLMQAVNLIPNKIEQRDTAQTRVSEFVESQLKQMNQRRSRTGGRYQ